MSDNKVKGINAQNKNNDDGYIFEDIETIKTRERYQFQDKRFENYQITKNGDIFSHGCYLRPRTINNRFFVTLPFGRFYIDDLVAMVFVPRPSGMNKVRHIDGNIINNNADNLEWTYVENPYEISSQINQIDITTKKCGQNV